ncbi:hypothetical protein Droror1_Dr00005120 [Drosera rotundifolia]
MAAAKEKCEEEFGDSNTQGRCPELGFAEEGPKLKPTVPPFLPFFFDKLTPFIFEVPLIQIHLLFPLASGIFEEASGHLESLPRLASSHPLPFLPPLPSDPFVGVLTSAVELKLQISNVKSCSGLMAVELVKQAHQMVVRSWCSARGGSKEFYS